MHIHASPAAIRAEPFLSRTRRRRARQGALRSPPTSATMLHERWPGLAMELGSTVSEYRLKRMIEVCENKGGRVQAIIEASEAVATALLSRHAASNVHAMKLLTELRACSHYSFELLHPIFTEAVRLQKSGEELYPTSVPGPLGVSRD